MKFYLLIILSFIFIGIPGILNYLLRKDTNKILKRINPKYTEQVNNPFDFFRIIKAYRLSREINTYEKRKLRLSIILVSISWIAGLILFTTFIFFSDQILD
jgi:hypothetical protein